MTKAEQKALSVEEFMKRIKCCYNCPSWQRLTGMTYCFCNLDGRFLKSAWDYCCDEYSGLAKEENLLVRSKKPPKKANKAKEAK